MKFSPEIWNFIILSIILKRSFNLHFEKEKKHKNNQKILFYILFNSGCIQQQKKVIEPDYSTLRQKASMYKWNIRFFDI